MTGAAALPANLSAETTEVAPARFDGTASTASVLRPAHATVDPAPATNQRAAVTPADPATPSATTTPAHTSEPAITAATRPKRSTARPPARPETMPATPKVASTTPRIVEPRPNASLRRSATRKPRPVTPA